MNKGRVIITDLRTAEAQSALRYLNAQGYNAEPIPESVCLWDEASLRAYALEKQEDLVAVIHPAPPVFQLGFEQANESDFAKARDEGPMAAWCVTKVFGVLFREKRNGVLIYLNSIHAEKPVGRGFLFSAGCGAVQMLNREVNQDYGTSGVRCYFVERGTSGGDPDLRSDVSSAFYGVDLRRPDRKMPGSEELNGLLGFLLTPSAAPLSGSDLRADGGQTLYYGQRISKEDAVRLYGPTGEKAWDKEMPVESTVNAMRGKVALVTGSGKGVGAGIVKVLCRAGVRCCINCNTNLAMAENTLRQVRAEGGEAFLMQADVSDETQVKALVEETVKRYGQLDILANNAAMQYNRFIDEYDYQTIARQWDINLGGYWRCAKAAVRYLRQSPAGRIVNIGSIHGKRPTCFDPGYAMTKGGIRMFTRELALELFGDHITVNAIGLGGCRIEFKTGRPAFHNTRPKEVGNPHEKPGQRLVTPIEVGHTVLYLCSDGAGALNGDTIRMDRGLVLT